MKVYIETYGCALNRGDTAVMKTILLSRGHEIVDDPREADVIVINTCVVRYDTEVRMVKRIRELSKLGKKIIVAGCMARALPIAVRKVNPRAVLLSPQSIARIEEAIHAPEGSVFLDQEKNIPIVPFVIDGVKGVVAVAEGCLDECAFCIVKIARPHLKSIPIERVVETVKEMIKRGAIEIELTAQDLAVYGVDIYGRYALIDLLEAILELEYNFRLRIGQLNPRYLANYLDRLIEILRDPRVYKHLHIPVQSGNDIVLNAMNRGHSVQEFIDIISELKNKIVGIHIATDIIVGHPGEYELAFLDSVKLIVDNLIDRVHIARYSPRPLTKAISMPQIPDPIKKLRSRYIEQVYELIGLTKNLEYIGSKARIIITEKGMSRNTVVGRLYNYRPVVLQGGDELLGREAIVVIERATFYDLRGRILELL